MKIHLNEITICILGSLTFLSKWIFKYIDTFPLPCSSLPLSPRKQLIHLSESLMFRTATQGTLLGDLVLVVSRAFARSSSRWRVRDGKNCTTKVEVCVYICAQLYPTLYDSMDCNLSGSFVHGIFQSRILEWVPISYSRGFSLSRDQTHVSFISWICRRILYS